ncbi:MAG: acireductone dioxygenase [Scytonematopsis contorta HA4267-MV1]|jgi:1,2-dihydroxy-3-keto-5-methylthiopentene dioxygenase|nr:acireductone dioxygenase [Scytonematopsis contorta HA4267-MV1]
MSILKLDNGEIIRNESEIQLILAPLYIQVRNCYSEKLLDDAINSSKALSQDVLDYSEKNQVLHLHSSFLDSLKQEFGSLWYDLLVLHPGSANLFSLTRTYSRYHTHTDAEALYLLSGEALFGFIRPDGSHVQLLLEKHDYIHIPAGCEHWFSLTASLNLKAVRYFATTDGWMPQHTGRKLNLGIS